MGRGSSKIRTNRGSRRASGSASGSTRTVRIGGDSTRRSSGNEVVKGTGGLTRNDLARLRRRRRESAPTKTRAAQAYERATGHKWEDRNKYD